MKRNAGIFLVLLALAVVPVTCTFLFSGDKEDRVRRPSEETPVAAEPEEEEEANAVAEARPAASAKSPTARKAIPKITAAQVKAHIIQETGGGDMRSRAAWSKDPLQVNVPGDWNPYKKYLGLKQPRHLNEGSREKNLKAGLMLLVRKGFGMSGQPAGNRPDGAFDGWPRALQRYNGRSDKAASGKPYSEAYSERIRERAKDPAKEVPISIPTKKK